LLQPIEADVDHIGRKPSMIFFGVAGTMPKGHDPDTLKETNSPFTAFLMTEASGDLRRRLHRDQRDREAETTAQQKFRAARSRELTYPRTG